MNLHTLKTRLEDSGLELTTSINNLIHSLGTEISLNSKLESKMNYLTANELSSVHPDKDTAKELILIILSNFSNTHTMAQRSENIRVKSGYKILYSKLLENQVKYSSNITSPYKKILKILLNNDIIERGRCYVKGERSNEYRLATRYFGKGVVKYQLKTDVAKRLANKQKINNLERCSSTIIGRNALFNLERIEMPTIETVKEHLKQKVKEGYTNKKGKKLVTKGKNPKRYADRKDVIFLEDYIEMYSYLKDHFNIPIVTEENAGYRVITKWNLMPTVIRELIKIDDNSLVECDYSTLHPNIANRIYRGNNDVHINHTDVAEYLGLTRKEVKKLHLSFFNLKLEDMKRSPLYKYYEEKHSDLLFKVENDKMRHNHKITSEKMFKIETEMMETVVNRLQKEGVDVVYVFDCLTCKPQHQQIVKDEMNKVSQEFKVKTQA